MREKLLEVLAEPGTGAALELRDAQGTGGRIESGSLVSSATGKRYPIVRGIPRFVEGETYAETFGMQWNAYRDFQLDSSTGASHSRDRFDAETHWDEETLRGKWTLDAGCGAGRFAEIAAARKAELVALDYSSAVEATAKTLSRFDNVDVVQASLLEPPFRPGSFDFAYCIGVIQHTPDPARGVREVVRVLRDGGRFSFSIYARQPWTKLNAKYLIRPLTRRLPATMLRKGIEAVMPVAFPVTEVLFKLPLVGKVAKFTIPIANYDRGDFSYEQRYREAVLDTFDMLAPAFDSPMTWGEVEAELRAVGAANWHFQTRVPVNVVGTR